MKIIIVNPKITCVTRSYSLHIRWCICFETSSSVCCIYTHSPLPTSYYSLPTLHSPLPLPTSHSPLSIPHSSHLPPHNLHPHSTPHTPHLIPYTPHPTPHTPHHTPQSPEPAPHSPLPSAHLLITVFLKQKQCISYLHLHLRGTWDIISLKVGLFLRISIIYTAW